MKRNRRRKGIIIGLVCVLLVCLVWVLWGNSALMTQEIRVVGDKLPQDFEGFRIAQVSDLHNTDFGENHHNLMEQLKAARPDIIVLTGDLVDSYHTKLEISLAFAAQAVDLAPTYFVPGNHEARIEAYDGLKAGLEEIGVVVLENEAVTLRRGGDAVTLLGVKDPGFQTDYLLGDAAAVMNQALAELTPVADTYTILLSHRPELFDCYVAHDVNLVFSGHAHGGQFRLPLIGGLVAPGQGLFPAYDAGLYTEAATNMIVSRGIGNSVIPLRFNNRPELVVAELTAGE